MRSSMLFEQQLHQAHCELVSSGFRPTRYAGLVKLIRRFIWPFIRPFAFNLLDRIILLQGQMAEMHNDFARLKEGMEENVARAVFEQSVLRSDVAALKNIYVNSQLSEKLSELSQRIDNSSSREQQELLRSDVDALKENLSHGQNRASYLAVTTTKDGLFIGKPGELISEHIFAGGSWDSHIVHLAQEVSVSSSGIAIDVGAHFGAITIALSNMFQEVLSFEPNDFNYRVLCGNIAINRLENVRLFNHALYSKEIMLCLGEDDKQEIPVPKNTFTEFNGNLSNNLGAYLFTEGDDRPFGHVARTLDSFGLSNVSFIKVDAQGADGEVLLGAMDTIKRCLPVVVFEWEERLSRQFSVSFDDLCKEFEGLDYQVSPLKVHNEKQIDYVARPHSGRA